jgi:hypothetical protein
MASSTIGRLFLLYRTTDGNGQGKWGARCFGAGLRASGELRISGTTKSGAVAAARRVIVMTQPPAPRVVYEVVTTEANNAFAFAHLPPGNYTVLDCADDGSRKALVYDWVAAG